MRIHSNRVQKLFGWIFATLGLVLIILGLIIYLNGPYSTGTTLWEIEGGTTRRIKPNEFIDYPYRLSLPEALPLIPRVHTNISIDVRGGRGIRAYFMNETVYFYLKNDTAFSKEIEEFRINLDDIIFEPRYNITYYIVLTNIGNESTTVYIQTRTFYMIRVFDFNYAFMGLRFSLIGGLMFGFAFVLVIHMTNWCETL